MYHFNSTIKRKMCKCGCGKMPALGYNGYAGKSHMPEDMQLLPKYNKKAVSIRKQSVKTQLSKKLHEVNDVNKVAQWEWFVRMRERMTGVCAHCGGSTTKNDDKTFHYSIAHILPKAYFKSVATNDFNWIELCFYGNSCHDNYDRNMIDLMDLNCFSEVIEKFAKIYPAIATEEKRRIPSILIEYIKTEL